MLVASRLACGSAQTTTPLEAVTGWCRRSSVVLGKDGAHEALATGAARRTSMGHGRRGGDAQGSGEFRTRNGRCDSRPAPVRFPEDRVTAAAGVCCCLQSTAKPPTRGCFSANLRRSRPALWEQARHTVTIKPLETLLDTVTSVRVHLDAFIAEQRDMGVCDAIEKSEHG